jgi:uncharacterized membrane protein YsdA (DUF1294 family)
MLVLPILAFRKAAASFAMLYLPAYLTGISGLTVFAYRHDKRKAESRGWRTAESTLHGCELLGGWAAAFVAQRIFRHKISKPGYQAVFWLIGAFHQYLAFDYLLEWSHTRKIFRLISSALQ